MLKRNQLTKDPKGTFCRVTKSSRDHLYEVIYSNGSIDLFQERDLEPVEKETSAQCERILFQLLGRLGGTKTMHDNGLIDIGEVGEDALAMLDVYNFIFFPKKEEKAIHCIECGRELSDEEVEHLEEMCFDCGKEVDDDDMGGYIHPDDRRA